MKGNPLLCSYGLVSTLFVGSVLALLQAAEDMEGDGLVDMTFPDTTSAVWANTICVLCYLLCYTLFCCKCGILFLHASICHVPNYSKDHWRSRHIWPRKINCHSASHQIHVPVQRGGKKHRIEGTPATCPANSPANRRREWWYLSLEVRGIS